MNLNALYITIGGAIIVALVAALVGPYLIDWTAYRANFEQYAERMLGHKVRVLGKADASILPTPMLTFTDVRVGPEDNPLMTVEKFSVHIELTPLLKGEIQVIDMKLEKPNVRLSLDNAGKLDWMQGTGPSQAALAVKPDAIELNDVEITDGTVTIADGRTGRSYVGKSVNLLVDASSLLGPFKLEGGMLVEGSPYSVKLATGRWLANNTLRIKAQVLPANFPVAIAFDGHMANKNGVPDYSGKFSLTRLFGEELPSDTELPEEEGNLPWKAEGDFNATADGLKLSGLNITHGPEDKPYSFSGYATLWFGDDPRFEALFRTKQINLDRIIGKGPENPADIRRAFLEMVDWLTIVPVPAIRGNVELDFPVILVGDGLIRDMKLSAYPEKGAWELRSLDALLPGDTRLSASGTFTAGEDLRFDGHVVLDSRLPADFAGWWRRGDDLPPLRVNPFKVDTNLVADRSGFKLTETTIDSAGARIAGEVDWRPPTGRESTRFTAALRADTLDLDQMLAMAWIMGTEEMIAGREVVDETHIGRGPPVIGVTLKADAVRYKGLSASQVDVETVYRDGNLTIGKLNVSRLAGVRIAASGKVSNVLEAPDGKLTGSLEADDPDELIRLLSAVWPNSPIIARFARAEASLGPVRLTATFEARGLDGETDAGFRVKGDAGGTAIDLAAAFGGSPETWREGSLAFRTRLDNANGVTLIRQLGIPAVPLGDARAGSVALAFDGRVADVLKVTASADIEGLVVKAAGDVSLPVTRPARFDGRVDLETDDVSRVALLAGEVLPILTGKVPVKFTSKVSAEGKRFDFTTITGKLVGEDVVGDLTLDLDRDVPNVAGELTTKTIDIGLLSELILGSGAWSEGASGTGGMWPTASFGPPLVGGISADVKIAADTVNLPLGAGVRRAVFDFRLRPNELSIDNLKAEAVGGSVEGHVRLRRSGGSAVANGDIKLVGASIEDLAWTREGRPVATGAIDLTLNFEGTGRSISAIVGGLSGSGAFDVRNGQIRYVNPQAFNSVIRAMDAGLELKPDKIRTAFEGHLDSGVMNFSQGSGVLALAGGTVRTRNVSFEGDSATMFVAAAFDLERNRLKSDWTMKIDPGENRVTGAEPQVGLVFEGPIGDPHRRIDIAPLTAYLTLRAFELKVREIEIMQADILERERFVRNIRLARRGADAIAKSREIRSRLEEETRPTRPGRRSEIPVRTAPEKDAGSGKSDDRTDGGSATDGKAGGGDTAGGDAAGGGDAGAASGGETKKTAIGEAESGTGTETTKAAPADGGVETSATGADGTGGKTSGDTGTASTGVGGPSSAETSSTGTSSGGTSSGGTSSGGTSETASGTATGESSGTASGEKSDTTSSASGATGASDGETGKRRSALAREIKSGLESGRTDDGKAGETDSGGTDTGETGDGGTGTGSAGGTATDDGGTAPSTDDSKTGDSKPGETRTGGRRKGAPLDLVGSGNRGGAVTTPSRTTAPVVRDPVGRPKSRITLDR